MKSFTSIIAIALPLTIRLACVPIPVPAQTGEYIGNIEGGNFAKYEYEAMLALPDRKERMNLLRLCVAEGYKGEFEVTLADLRMILGCEDGFLYHLKNNDWRVQPDARH